MIGSGNYYGIDHTEPTEGDINCFLCDATSETVEAHHRHMEVVHDC
ncbi:hypothetical protein IL252_16815 [Halomicrobium sp. IBSBa]|nr:MULTISPECIES: hypothetical protein [Halomicrobium]MBO4249471.1 hypothetical protein [Halomicrobium sp. IBSBa]